MALAVVAGNGNGFTLVAVLPQVDDLDAGTAQQVHAVVHTVVLTEHDATDACLDDEFATLHAGRCGDIERRSVAAVVAAGNLGDGVGLGMQDIGLGPLPALFLLLVLPARRRAVLAVASVPSAPAQQRAYLSTFTIGIFGPNLRHAQVP